MPGRKRIDLTSSAQQDLLNILHFTRIRWGARQRDIYHRRLRAGFSRIAEYPEIGKLRPELDDDVRSWQVGSHIVIYHPGGDAITLLRIVHENSDLENLYDPW